MPSRHLDPTAPPRMPADPERARRRRTPVVGIGLLAAALASPAAAGLRPGQSPQQGAAAVRSEFRVFAGAVEVTGETRLRLAPSGSAAPGMTVEPLGPITLAPGLYDAQAVRLQDDRVVAIRRAERLVIVRYPDEGDLHLEVINFDPRFGAIQLRSPAGGGAPQDYAAVAFDPDDHDRPIVTGLRGETYVLLVAPSGIYDIRISAEPGAGGSKRTDLWLLGVEVQADRTKLKLLPPDWGRLAAPRGP